MTEQPTCWMDGGVGGLQLQLQLQRDAQGLV